MTWKKVSHDHWFTEISFIREKTLESLREFSPSAQVKCLRQSDGSLDILAECEDMVIRISLLGGKVRLSEGLNGVPRVHVGMEFDGPKEVLDKRSEVFEEIYRLKTLKGGG